MSSVVKTTGVNLNAPTGNAAAVDVLDTGGGTKIAAAVVTVKADGSAVEHATETTLASANAALGAAADAEATSNGSINAILKRIRTLLTGTLAVSGTFWQATQPVSVVGTINTNNGFTQPLTDAQLRASAVPVSDTNIGAQADSAAGSDTATASLIALFKRHLLKQPSIGQGVKSASSPVTIASDQNSLAPVTASGSITTQNLVPAGVATAGSAIEITLNSESTLAIQVTGTYTGALSLQVTVDGSVWVTVAGVPFINLNTGGMLATITSALQSVFQVEVTGFAKARLTALAAVTGTAAVSLRAVCPTTLVTLDAALPTGANTIGAISALPAGTNAVGDVGTQYRANATGAASGAHIVSAGSTNATVVKASAGRVVGWQLSNTTASWKYVKLHNQTSSPTAGTGVVRTIGIPPNGKSEIDLEGGIAFTTGIGLTIVTGSADSDNTAVAAGDVVGDLFYS